MCTMLAELMASEKNIPAIPALITGCFGEDIPLSECTKPRLNTLRKYILGRVSQNSARVYMANIKAVLNIYADELPSSDLSLLNVRAEATVSVYLSTDELERLEKCAGGLRGRERMYALYFLCSAWCGARVSDIRRIGPDSIHRGRLVYVCEKTGAKAEVPVKKGLDTWLAELEGLRQANGFCERTYNRTIKEVCRRAGICSEVRGFRGARIQRRQGNQVAEVGAGQHPHGPEKFRNKPLPLRLRPIHHRPDDGTLQRGHDAPLHLLRHQGHGRGYEEVLCVKSPERPGCKSDRTTDRAISPTGLFCYLWRNFKHSKQWTDLH